MKNYSDLLPSETFCNFCVWAGLAPPPPPPHGLINYKDTKTKCRHLK